MNRDPDQRTEAEAGPVASVYRTNDGEPFRTFYSRTEASAFVPHLGSVWRYFIGWEEVTAADFDRWRSGNPKRTKAPPA